MDVITFPVNLYTTSGLSILLNGIISLPNATSYDKMNFQDYVLKHSCELYKVYALRATDLVLLKCRVCC